MKYTYPLGAVMGALLLPCSGVAQTLPDENDTVVTVSRHDVKLKALPQSVSVIHSRQVEATLHKPFVALIEDTPSVNILRYGGNGQTASVSLRGAGNDHTLILLDGIRLEDPSLVGGGSHSGLISLADVDHIEILRGPFSTLWGSGAIGGVISMTSKAAYRPLEGQVRLSGFADYAYAQAAMGANTGALNWRVAASQSYDRGISAYDRGTEKDSFSLSQTFGQVRFNLTQRTKLFGLAQFTQSRTEFDGYTPPTYTFGDTGEYGKSQTLLASAGAKHEANWGDVQLSYGLTVARRRNFDADNALTFTADGQINSFEGVIHLNLSDKRALLMGIGTRQDTMSVASPSSWDPYPVPLKARNTQAHLFALYRQTFANGLEFDVGARRINEHREKSGLAAQMGFIAPLSSHVRLKASLGNGYKTPSLYQLYSEYGQEALRPEYATQGEVGLVFEGKHLALFVVHYRRNIHDLIGFASCYGIISSLCTAHPYGYYDNIKKAQSHGLEADLIWQVRQNLRLNFNASFQSNRNRSPDFKTLDLARTPRVLMNSGIHFRPAERWDIGLKVRYRGESYDDAANLVRLKAFGVADVTLSYDLGPKTQLSVHVENIADSSYQTVKDYGQAGRRIWIGLRQNY